MNIRNGLLAALVVLVIGVSVVSPQTPNATVQAAESALGAGNLTAVKVTGAGSSAMIGQGLAAGVPAKWVLADYVAEFDFANPGLRITLERTLLDGGVPFGGNRQVWLLSGDVAWHEGATGMPAALNPRPDTQLSSLEERQIQVWTTAGADLLRSGWRTRCTDCRRDGRDMKLT